MCTPALMGSTPSWGMLPWVPLPVTVTVTVSQEDISAPLREKKVPAV